ncbi:hypothetical protein TNCV_2062341 [Trichonephila clavipes]|nr:hypothetical protein TNCV_2062341 [Trichonephila clavipes]
MAEKISRRGIRTHYIYIYEQLSEFQRDRIIELKEAGWANRRITRQMVEAMWPLKDAGKNGWEMADFSVMMLAFVLGPQHIGRTN